MSPPSPSKESSPKPAVNVAPPQSSQNSPPSTSGTSGAMGDHSRIGLASGWGIVKDIDISPAGNRFVVTFSESVTKTPTDLSLLGGGFRIYDMDPVKEVVHVKAEQIGSHIKKAYLIGSSLWVAMTFTGVPAVPQAPGLKVYSPNFIYVAHSQNIAKRAEFNVRDEVISVASNFERFAAVSRSRITVFRIKQPASLLYVVPTRENPLGLCCITQMSSINAAPSEIPRLMLFPGSKLGSVQIMDLGRTDNAHSAAPVAISAHDHELQCISMNLEGTMIATASKHGTLVRIWDSVTKLKLAELRRGSDQASIYCINFNSTGDWLCCSSDKGTVHIFSVLKVDLNKKSALQMIGLKNGIAGSSWSYSKFQVPQEVACVCTFGKDNQTVVAACLDGSYHKYQLSSGQCEQLEYDVFTEQFGAGAWQAMWDSIWGGRDRDAYVKRYREHIAKEKLKKSQQQQK